LANYSVNNEVYQRAFANQVIRKSDNKVYALKRVKINKMGKKEIADALNEIRFLAGIRHKNVVGFLEAFLGIYSRLMSTSHQRDSHSIPFYA
jgi:NIMA (never in mitosis gene a)-related kinase